jgi:hypothetical protein
MTITANNQKIKKSLINEATLRAKDTKENVAIVEAPFNGERRQCLALVSQYEKSPNKEDIEILMIIAPDGKMVD